MLDNIELLARDYLEPSTQESYNMGLAGILLPWFERNGPYFHGLFTNKHFHMLWFCIKNTNMQIYCFDTKNNDNDIDYENFNMFLISKMNCGDCIHSLYYTRKNKRLTIATAERIVAILKNAN